MSILITIVATIVIFAIYRFITVKRQNKQLNEVRFNRIKPLYDKLESGQVLTEQDILPYVENILTRQTVFHLLNEHNKADLFPKAYYTLVKGAESNLANWLEFPTELGACVSTKHNFRERSNLV